MKPKENYIRDESASSVRSSPERIVLELATGCNLSCPMCPRYHLKLPNSYIKGELWKRLVDEVAESFKKTIVIPFWRGESTLHPDFIKLIRYALDRSVRMHISTNGHLLDGKTMEALSLLELVTFSVHDEGGYLNAKKFLKFKKKSKPIVQISFVKCEDTAGKFLNELISSADLCGFDSVRLYEEHSKGGVFGSSQHRLSAARIFCPRLQDTLVVACDGAISRCCYIWQSANDVDMNVASIKDAWDSDYLRGIRNNYPDGKCAVCDQWCGRTLGEFWQNANGKIEHKIFMPDSGSI